MEQELIADGIPSAQIRAMCDLHSQAVRDVLTGVNPPEVPPGHPVDTFRRENGALRELAGRVRSALAALGAAPEDEPVSGVLVEQARAQHGLLMEVGKHYLRKEHLLFPFLEKHGITGPSTVMWAKDDEVRTLLKELGEALAASDATAGEWRLVAEAVAEPALSALEEMIFKEERILLPMALQNLTEPEWGEIAVQSPQIGYCLAEPAEEWPPRPGDPLPPIANTDAGPPSPPVEPGQRVPAALVFPSGSLSLAQLEAVFAALPVDLTFVDADDRVRFFSEGRHRVFHRARAVIGRRVQNCHPPSSVHVVDRILADFRSGARSVAEFWIQMGGRFVHVRYFALRDDGGAYLGTLEATQDLTRERALEGERRLLQYES